MSKNIIHTTEGRSWPGRNQPVILESDTDAGSVYQNFEQQYLLLRGKENRIYTDEELATLPIIDKRHPHYKEWLVRKHSFNRLMAHLGNKNKSLEILEVGCGNGWLSNQLSIHVSCQVTGLDINRSELEQAARVFQSNTECTFMYGDIRSELLNHRKFDIILFAASLQYFRSLKETVSASLKLLKNGGEIIIIDTYFYKDYEVAEAQQRSKSHFTSLGFPAMSMMYFHHSLSDIKEFNPVILYNPYSFKNKFLRSTSPFYQLSIGKE